MKPQRIRVAPAVESERVTRHASLRPDSGPLRCQLWDGERHVDTVPVRFDHMGHPSDIRWKARDLTRVTRLAFVWGARVFVYPLGEVRVPAGQTLHLALGHLRLLDRYGTDALNAGR